MRRIDHHQVEPRDTGPQQPGRRSEQVLKLVDRDRIAELGKHGGVAGEQRGGGDPLGSQEGREGTRNIRQPARLDEREEFGNDRENRDGLQPKAFPLGAE